MTKRARAIAELRQRRAFLAAIGKRHRRRGPVPRQIQPDAIRLSYFRDLVAMLEEARALVQAKLVKRLPAMVAAREAAKTAHQDAEVADLSATLDDIAEAWFAQFPNEVLAQEAQKIAGRTAVFQREQLARQFKSALGVDVLRSEPWLAPKVEAFTSENVSLIKSLPRQYFAQVESTITSGMREGLRWEDIASDLGDRFGVAESRAKLIARDQVGKWMGDLNEARQQDLGVTRFRWRTAKDNRVREEHQALEGQVFAWDDPPSIGIPGEPINCRCQAEPVLDDLIDELSSGAAAQAPDPFLEELPIAARAPDARMEV